MHAGDGVEEGSDGVVLVLVEVARAGEVLHQESAVRPKGLPDPGQDQGRALLVVNGVERRYQVETALLTQPGYVPRLKQDVFHFSLTRQGAGTLDGLMREVKTGEAASRVGGRHADQSAAAAATDIEHVDATLQPIRDTRHQGQDVLV